MDFSVISVKEKIKLLSDIQDLLENQELKSGFMQLDSGEIIWSLISDHLQDVTEDLLGSGEKKEVVGEVVTEMGKLLSLVKTVNASPLIQILSQIASRGINPQAQAQQPKDVVRQEQHQPIQQRPPVPSPSNPISMAPKVGTMGFL